MNYDKTQFDYNSPDYDQSQDEYRNYSEQSDRKTMNNYQDFRSLPNQNHPRFFKTNKFSEGDEQLRCKKTESRSDLPRSNIPVNKKVITISSKTCAT